MNLIRQKEKAEAFRKMHDRSRILILPNAWDVASAKIFEAAGFGAVATTSSGVANSLGYPDGEAVPRNEMMFVITRIARSLGVPVSADIEAGYAADVAGLKATIKDVVDAGAIGINLEDSLKDGSPNLFPIETAVDRIKAAREAASAAGVPIVINARTDVFLHGVGEKSSRVDHAVKRANAYLAAGADCAFVPAVVDPAIIEKLVKAIDGPINLLAIPGLPSAPELEKLGVARVSIGGGPARAALTTTRRIAEELRTSGTYSLFLSADTVSHAEANKLMSPRG